MKAQELRERSGEFDSSDPLVSFLYELMRDRLPAGVVEQIVNQSPPMRIQFTNGYLARYAQDIADRLRANPKMTFDSDEMELHDVGVYPDNGTSA